jgi:hypothetical protein
MSKCKTLLAGVSVASMLTIVDCAATDMTSGKQWLAWCRLPDLNSQWMCFGFVEGVVQANQVMVPQGTPGRLCVPPDVPRAHLTDIVVGQVGRIPQRQDLPFAKLVLEVLASAFPCER